MSPHCQEEFPERAAWIHISEYGRQDQFTDSPKTRFMGEPLWEDLPRNK